MHYSTIIIGAGISGIKAAVDLQAAGVSVLVLEARDRAGGRLLSIETPSGNTFDLGALWFHDSLRNPLFDQARRLGNIEYYYDDGKRVYLNRNGVIDEWTFDAALGELMTFIALEYAEKSDVSLEEACAEYVKRHPDNAIAAAVARMWGELWYGESWSRLSAKHAFGGEAHLGRNVLVKSGYSKVFQNVLHELPETFRRDNIHLAEPVTIIDHSQQLIHVTTTKASYTCDYIVLTIPYSLWNGSDLVKWTPPLPPHITKIQPDLQFAYLGKIFLEFDECFWPPDVDRFYAVTDAVPHTDPQPWDYPLLFLNYQAISGKPALGFLCQNPLSRHFERLTAEQIWALVKPVIAKFATGPVSAPRAVHKTPWGSDPWVRGSYGTIPVNLNPEQIVETLQKGISPRVRLAGAETTPGSANGCAHGGWFSGQREAAYIVKQTKRLKI